MNVRISPSKLSGHLDIPASKSCAHRVIICAALANGTSHISGVSMSKDIEATIGAMKALGADFIIDGSNITVTGIGSPAEKAVIDCNESGSTLRFIIPVAAALGTDSRFIGRGRLPQRPIDIYKRELSKHGVRFITEEMPYDISGKLTGGVYEVEGNVSSQFITGLLFALPLLEGDSVIKLTSHLESRPYVDITVDILRRFGISVTETEDSYSIRGGQSYTPHDEKIEGDYSQAAFFYVANATGSSVDIGNLNEKSVQGDKKILDIISEMCYNGNRVCFSADCSDIPDLVPILTVLASYGSEKSVIYNAERLRIKESDRLETSAAMINALGGDVSVTDDGLIIRPCGQLRGGTVDGCGDHRIVMAAAVAALGCSGDVIIKGAEAAEKSYPEFFKDLTALGGKVNVIDME
ncbi:MAG TPA: 3-phosphoshikimate 1-carboxyvinyltransferase [Ruminococcus sp.]|nr:3-phosphoshikimate 1-carboxyvinyltransferase [Ruminococcus sp.]